MLSRVGKDCSSGMRLHVILKGMNLIVKLIVHRKLKGKKKDLSQKPLLLVIVTPPMAHAHSQIQQVSEMVFCDSTAFLDRFYTSIFVILTATAMSGVPLAVLLTSDEREDTVFKAFQLLKKVVPSGNNPSVGATDIRNR